MYMVKCFIFVERAPTKCTKCLVLHFYAPPWGKMSRKIMRNLKSYNMAVQLKYCTKLKHFMLSIVKYMVFYLPDNVAQNSQLHQPVDQSDCFVFNMNNLRSIIFKCSLSYYRTCTSKAYFESLPSRHDCKQRCTKRNYIYRN